MSRTTPQELEAQLQQYFGVSNDYDRRLSLVLIRAFAEEYFQIGLECASKWCITKIRQGYEGREADLLRIVAAQILLEELPLTTPPMEAPRG